jgi:hypothetical protein
MYVETNESGILCHDRLLSLVALRYVFFLTRSVTYDTANQEPVVPL